MRAEVPENKLGTNIFDKIQAIRKAQDAWVKRGQEGGGSVDVIAELKAAFNEGKVNEDEIEVFLKSKIIIMTKFSIITKFCLFLQYLYKLLS